MTITTKLVIKSRVVQTISDKDDFKKYSVMLKEKLEQKKEVLKSPETIERNEELDKLNFTIRSIKHDLPYYKKNIDSFFKITDEESKKEYDEYLNQLKPMTFDDEPPEINAKRNIWCTRCGENWDLCNCLSFSKNQKLRYSRKMCEHKILDGNAKYAWCHNPNCFSDMTDTDKGKKTIQENIKHNKDYEVEIYNNTIEELIQYDSYLVKITVEEKDGKFLLDIIEEYPPKIIKFITEKINQ